MNKAKSVFVYYFLRDAQTYKEMGWDIKDFPNTFDYYHNLITLPLHTKLSDEDVDYILDNLESVIK